MALVAADLAPVVAQHRLHRQIEDGEERQLVVVQHRDSSFRLPSGRRLSRRRQRPQPSSVPSGPPAASSTCSCFSNRSRQQWAHDQTHLRLLKCANDAGHHRQGKGASLLTPSDRRPIGSSIPNASIPDSIALSPAMVLLRLLELPTLCVMGHLRRSGRGLQSSTVLTSPATNGSLQSGTPQRRLPARQEGDVPCTFLLAIRDQFRVRKVDFGMVVIEACAVVTYFPSA